MSDRPVLMSAPMVRAILAGTKTQTRRVVKPQPERSERGVLMWTVSKYRKLGFQGRDVHPELHEHCPYGQPGDRLWVREAFIHEPADYCWEASVSIPCRPATTVYRADHDGDTRGAGWKPSIHMPRWASRITLEVTGVRVERLQEISEADARAEGIEPVGEDWKNYGDPMAPCIRPRTSFATLWASINGPGSWDANPWVWVVEFKRVPQGSKEGG